MIGGDNKPERLPVKQRLAVSYGCCLILEVGEIRCLAAVDERTESAFPHAPGFEQLVSERAALVGQH